MNSITEQHSAAAASVAPLPWQGAVWQQLCASLQHNRLHHALLFVGEEGIGKTAFADAWAQRLLCQETPTSVANGCGHCKSCQLFEAGNHVDFVTIAPQAGSAQIKIDQVRALSGFVYAKPQIASRRVVMITPADMLNMAASNALLKCLEEPVTSTFFLLVTAQLNSLLPTVRSRCYRQIFQMPDWTESTGWLREQAALTRFTQDELTEALQVARGAPLKAAQLLERDQLSHYLTARHSFYSLLLGTSQLGTSQDGVVSLAEAWSSDDLTQSLRWLATWSHEAVSHLMATTVALQTRGLSHCFSPSGEHTLLATALLEVGFNHAPHQLLLQWIDREMRRLSRVSEEYDVRMILDWCRVHAEAIFYFYQHVIELLAQIRTGANPNKQVTLEALLLRWQALVDARQEE